MQTKTFSNIQYISSHVLIFAILLLVSMAPSLSGGVAFGVGASGSDTGGRFANPLGGTSDLSQLLNSLLKVVMALGSIVVVFFIILAGFNYVTARGDEKKIQAATKTLTWTAVGAAVILGAQVISTAIQGTVSELGVGK